MTRKLQINFSTPNGVTTSTTISFLNTSATVAQCHDFATNTIALTSNSFISANIIDTTPAELSKGAVFYG